MRAPLSKGDRQEISETVLQLISQYLKSQGFKRCRAKYLWSKDFDYYTGFIRFKRVLNFSEWPVFQLNFGFTPKFSVEVTKILRVFLKNSTPMYEAWAHDPQALEKRHKKNYKGVYSSVYPGTWEFRNAQEVTDKVSKIHQFIYDYYSSFLELRATDEYIASVGFNSINELPPSFRVLQIIAFGNLHQTENIEVLLSYYKGKNFGTSGSKFAKLVETYGDQLHAHFN